MAGGASPCTSIQCTIRSQVLPGVPLARARPTDAVQRLNGSGPNTEPAARPRVCRLATWTRLKIESPPWGKPGGNGLISDAHEWITEIPTVPTYYLAKPQPRERSWQSKRGKKTLKPDGAQRPSRSRDRLSLVKHAPEPLPCGWCKQRAGKTTWHEGGRRPAADLVAIAPLPHTALCRARRGRDATL